MKYFLAAFVVLALSPAAFAVGSALECKSEAEAIAKMNLDQKARAYQDEQADMTPSLTKLKKGSVSRATYEVIGAIYRTDYRVQVTVDSSCSVEAVRLTVTGGN